MKTAYVNYTGMNLDYGTARSLATLFAARDMEIPSPVMVAWFDRKSDTASPVLEGCAAPTSWHDYGLSHEGKLEVEVNGEFDFIFADGSAYESYGPSPYLNMHDQRGKEYICLANSLRHPHNPLSPSREACTALDEWTSKLT